MLLPSGTLVNYRNTFTINKLEFNHDQTKQATEVLFSYKISSPNHPQITFNRIVVAEMNEQKHLGLIL